MIVKLSKEEIGEAVAMYVVHRLPVSVKQVRINAYKRIDDGMTIYAEVDIVEDQTFHEGGPYR